MSTRCGDLELHLYNFSLIKVFDINELHEVSSHNQNSDRNLQMLTLLFIYSMVSNKHAALFVHFSKFSQNQKFSQAYISEFFQLPFDKNVLGLVNIILLYQ